MRLLQCRTFGIRLTRSFTLTRTLTQLTLTLTCKFQTIDFHVKGEPLDATDMPLLPPSLAIAPAFLPPSPAIAPDDLGLAPREAGPEAPAESLVRASPLVRAIVKFTVKKQYAVAEDSSRTAFLTVIFTLTRTSGAALRPRFDSSLQEKILSFSSFSPW